MSAKQSSLSNPSSWLFSELPERYRGWVRYDREDTLFEYWRAEATHIGGSFEQIAATARPRKSEVWLVVNSFDQFGHSLGTTTLLSQPPQRADYIRDRAMERMENYPGYGAFEEPPTMPSKLGEWELTRRKVDQRVDETAWEQGFGAAEMIVECEAVRSYYAHTERPHSIRYREIDMDAVEIVDGVPRTFAFEIAAHTLRNLPDPVTACSSRLEALQTVEGIGPAKSRQLSLLGIQSPQDLCVYVDVDENPVNHHHTEAVETLLTSVIVEDLRNGIEQEEQ